MRDLSTLTKEEITEFFDALNVGQIEIRRFKYIKSSKTFEISTITEWTCEDDEGKEEIVLQEDMWYFTLNGYETEFPEGGHSLLYYEFLLAKGFKENRFKTK